MVYLQFWRIWWFWLRSIHGQTFRGVFINVFINVLFGTVILIMGLVPPDFQLILMLFLWFSIFLYKCLDVNVCQFYRAVSARLWHIKPICRPWQSPDRAAMRASDDPPTHQHNDLNMLYDPNFQVKNKSFSDRTCFCSLSFISLRNELIAWNVVPCSAVCREMEGKHCLVRFAGGHSNFSHAIKQCLPLPLFYIALGFLVWSLNWIVCCSVKD